MLDIVADGWLGFSISWLLAFYLLSIFAGVWSIIYHSIYTAQ